MSVTGEAHRPPGAGRDEARRGQSAAAYALILALAAAAGIALSSLASSLAGDAVRQAGTKLVQTEAAAPGQSARKPAAIPVQVRNYTGMCDGKPHTGSVTVTEAGLDYTLRYRDESGAYVLESPPEFTGPGEWTAGFEVSAPGRETRRGAFRVSLRCQGVKLPVIRGTLRYTGAVQSPVTGEPDGDAVAVWGTERATEAGEYRICFSLREPGLVWEDGTAGDRWACWRIEKAELSEAALTPVPEKTWEGSPVRPLPALSFGGRTLEEGRDFEAAWTGGDGPGTGRVLLTALEDGNFRGSVSAAFTVLPGRIALEIRDAQAVYDGTPHRGTVRVMAPAEGASVRYGLSPGACTLTEPPERTEAGETQVCYRAEADGYEPCEGSFVLKVARAAVEELPWAEDARYTGSAVSPVWHRLDSGRLTAQGTLSAAEPGTYTAQFLPADNYEWPGGDRSARDVSWRLVRDAGTAVHTALLQGDCLPDGRRLSAVYTLREDWDRGRGISVFTLTGIRLCWTGAGGVPHEAEDARAAAAAGTPDSGGHGDWFSGSVSLLSCGEEQTVLAFIPEGDRSWRMDFRDPLEGVLRTPEGEALSGPSLTVRHGPNTRVKLAGYWSWESGDASEAFRGAVSGGEDLTCAETWLDVTGA